MYTYYLITPWKQNARFEESSHNKPLHKKKDDTEIWKTYGETSSKSEYIILHSNYFSVHFLLKISQAFNTRMKGIALCESTCEKMTLYHLIWRKQNFLRIIYLLSFGSYLHPFSSFLYSVLLGSKMISALPL